MDYETNSICIFFMEITASSSLDVPQLTGLLHQGACSVFPQLGEWTLRLAGCRVGQLVGCFEREGGRKGRAAEQIDLGLWWWGPISLFLICCSRSVQKMINSSSCTGNLVHLWTEGTKTPHVKYWIDGKNTLT